MFEATVSRNFRTGIRLLLMFALTLLPAVVCQAQPFTDDKVSIQKSSVATPATTGAATKAVLPKDQQTALDFNDRVDKKALEKYYYPIAEWTGRLILPEPQKRLPDGSVYINLTSAARPEMIGKTFRLVRMARDAYDGWLEKIRPDVKISAKAQADAKKVGNKIPLLLNGLKRVSALESLAAARPGEMDVIIPEPTIAGTLLLIEDDPIQISGSRKAMVRFEGQAAGFYRKVLHYNPKSRNFSGPAEYVRIDQRYFRKKEDTIPMTCTTGIENSAGNKEGWYIYGTRKLGMFHVEALEPRAALRVGNPAAVTGSKEIKNYLAKSAFAGLKPDLSRQVQWLPDKAAKNLWPVGSRGMLVHSFGWRKSPSENFGWRKSPSEKNNSGVILGLVTGHFAFGQAEVVKCPITGEPRWDIDYFQIYVHNPNHIVSCTQKWHAYMGNLRRGWMYTVPVSDTIARLPDNGLVKTAGKEFDMYRMLRREFEKMMAVYRTGGGTGTTAVRTDISCVQDSHAALYGTFRELEKFIKGANPAESANNANNSLKSRIEKMVKDIEANITFHGIPSGKWKAFYDKPESERYTNVFTIIFDSILSAGTIFPRNANDKMIEMLADHNLPMYNILTSQIGGRIEGLVPLAPTSPRRR